MLFHEIYGSYYNVIAAVLEEAVKNRADRKKINEIVEEKAFSESGIRIVDALADGSWPFLKKDGTTRIRQVPTMPLTEIEKAWMNAVLQDPRVRLFLPDDAEGALPFPETAPLFAPDFFIPFDRYEDGDPFTEPAYRERFRLILLGLKEKRYLRIAYTGKNGRHERDYIPDKLEYSPKDDKFRLVAHRENGVLYVINLARAERVQIGAQVPEEFHTAPEPRKKTVVFELVNERNALERAMIHFSDLEKETEKLDRSLYRVTLHYRGDDETEVLIRILSFGPKIRVTAPDEFIGLIRERLARQKDFPLPGEKREE